MNEIENIKYQLETLASFEPEDLDNPEFEVGYENNSGDEGFLTVCCIDLAQRSYTLIEKLETKLKQLHDASERMRSDLLIRGEIADNGTRIVNVSASVWESFCDAIDEANTK